MARSLMIATLVTASIASADPACHGSSEEPLVTDRPDFTESADSVQPRRVQIEAGYTREEGRRVDIDILGEILLRIGLSESLELRLSPGSYVEIDSLPGSASGFADPSVGLKLELGRGSENPSLFRPASALILSTTLPVGNEEVGFEEPLPAAILALEWAHSGPAAIAANVGVASEGEEGERRLVGIFSTAVGLDLNGAWGGFLEYFTLIPEGSSKALHFFDGGLTYLISSDFQLDVRAGTELGGDTDLFAGIGLAYRW